MRTVRLSLKDRAYPIFVGRGLLQHLGRLLKKRGLHQHHALVVSQKEISQHHSPLVQALTKEGIVHSFFTVPASKSSEAAKSQAVFAQLIKSVAAFDGKHKSLMLIALGGGVIGDLTGFAASVYRRGVPFVQVPSTLTAQVDSAIGGKTGIDLPQGKNLLGSVYQPALVVCDTALLDTLPERHWSDGFAEVIKYGVIKDPWLFSLLERYGKEGVQKNPRLLEKVIQRCVKIKARIVEKDEWDKKGLRIVLNFGHTAGHAIETASRFSRQYTHGEAVAVGMLVACDIGQSLGVLKDAGLTERLEQTLVKFGLPLYYKGLTQEALLKAMGYDKKNEVGSNRFVLPVALGKVTTVRDVPTDMISQALEKRKG